MPPDREHRFGHGKAEPLAALAQSAFLVGSALWLMAEAIRGLVSPQPVENPPVGIAVMVFSMIVTVALVTYQRHVVGAPAPWRSAPTNCITAATSSSTWA